MSGVVEGANGTYSKVNTLAEVVPGTFFISPTGAVTINPLLEDANNDNLAVDVTFTYPDGSSETARAAFPVGATLSQSFAAQYQDWTSVAFEKTVIPAPTVTPEYTSTVTYKAGDAPAGYTVKASAAEVTAAGDYFVAPNGGITVIPLAQSPVEFPVVATFADQSTQPITATLTVTSQAEAYAPSYETIPVEPAAVKSSAVIGDVPTGARFTATLEGYTPVDSAQDVPLGSFFIDPDTGLITVGIKPDQPRGELQALVTVTYPDGSQDENIPAVFDVSDNEAAKNSVNYQPVDAQPTVAVSATPVLNEGSPTPTYEGVSVHGAEGFTKVETTDGIAPGQYHVDTNTGVVTLVPRLEDANKRISVAVEATYPGDGSTAISDAVFNVGPSIADGMDPTYSPNYEAIAAQPIIPQDAKLQLGEGQTLPEGTTFSGALTGGQEPYTLVTEGNAQNPGEYSIAEDGTVWIVPRLEDADATLTVAVTLTYSDGSTDQADAVFQVGSAITDSYDPAYQDITGTPGLPATIAAPTGLPETGRTLSAETPAGFTAVEYAEAVTAPGHFFFDTATGEITLVPRIEDANKTVAVPVTVTYSDGSVDRLSPKVTVGTQASAYAPAYAPVPALPGVEVSIDAPVSDPAVPEGTTYTLGADLPAGYSADNVALAADGSITLTPPADAPVGTVSIPVVVKYPDGSEETIRATVNVQPLDGSVDFTVEGAAAQPGIPVTGGEAVFTEQGANEPADKPAGTTFSGTLEGYELQESRDDVNAPGEFYVDPETGAVTISAALEDAGETVEVKVTATYTDGTTDSAVAKFNVGDTQATTYAPEYAGAKAVINSPVTQDQLADNLPEGTKFSGELPGYTPAENPEEVKPGEFYVDPITGQVTVNAKLDDASQDLVVGVTVSYPDTSAETVDATFTVSKALSAVHVGTYGPTRGVVGEKTVIAAPTFDAELPEGVVPTFTLGEVAGYTAVDSADAVANEGHFYINPDGSIVVIPLAAGVVNIPVTVKFSDQSTAEITAPLTVATQAATYSPYYSSVNALPDNVSSSPLRTARTLPEGTTFEGSLEGYVEGNPDDLQRGQFYVNPDTGEVKVRPTLSDADKTLYVNVVATYADGSTDPMQAQFVVGPTRAAQFDASYDEQQALPAQVATSEPVLEDTFPTTAEFSGALDGYAEAAGADNVQPGQFFVDSSTGVVSVNPKLEDWGKPLSVAITVTYRDGSTDETTAAFAVGTQASTVDPEYPESTVKQEGKTTVEVTLPEGQQWPEGDLTFTEAEDNPNVEVAQDGTLTVTAPEGAQVGDVIEGTIIVTYPDGSTDELPYKFTVTAKDNVPSTLEDIDDQTVVEGKPITSVTPEASGDAPTITVDGLPDGVIFEDGTISGTPVVEEWGDDEARTFTVTITVSDTGDEDLVKTFDITVERDTDGDGVPDVNDEDDDGDGFTDAEEIKAGSDPKDPASTPAGVVLASVTVVEGQVIDPVAVKATVPAGGSVAVAGLPEGLSFDPDSGEVLGTPDRLSDWGDTEESREFDVTVTVVNADGDVVASDEVVWTVQRDTDGDGEPDLTDTDDDGDGVPDENEIAAGSDPKDPGSIPGTLIVPVAGIDPVADQSVVEGTEIDPFVVDPVKDEATVEVTVPEGLVFDEASGEVSGTPVVDVWGSDEESRDLDVVIVVTNPDGSKVTETVVVTVERDTDGDGEPDATDSDDDGDGFTDAEEIAAGSDPKDPGSIPATPLEPGTPSDAAEHEPDYQTTPVPVGGTETSNDPFEEDVELTGVTADPAEGWTLTPDDETGEITATAPSLGELAQAWEDAVAQAGETPLFDDLVAELGDILRPTVGVDVTYADGSQDLRKDASFVVVDASGNEFTPDGDFDGDGVTNAEELANGTNPFTTDEQSPAPDWTDVDNAEPGVELVIENIGGTVPEGATVRVPEGKGEATIGDNGDITFTPAEGVEPGETIELIVEDAEGNEIGRVTVTIGEDSPVVPVPDPGSSFDANKCFPAALGVGIPLLLLIPVGLSTQLDIPGMNPLVGQLSKEIQRINAEVTRASVRELKSNGLWIEPTPEMVRINELLRSVDPEVGRRAGGIALAAAGALALGFVVVSCMPGGSSMSSGSSGSSGSSLSSGSSMWGSSN